MKDMGVEDVEVEDMGVQDVGQIVQQKKPLTWEKAALNVLLCAVLGVLYVYGIVIGGPIIFVGIVVRYVVRYVVLYWALILAIFAIPGVVIGSIGKSYKLLFLRSFGFAAGINVLLGYYFEYDIPVLAMINCIILCMVIGIVTAHKASNKIWPWVKSFCCAGAVSAFLVYHFEYFFPDMHHVWLHAQYVFITLLFIMMPLFASALIIRVLKQRRARRLQAAALQVQVEASLSAAD